METCEYERVQSEETRKSELSWTPFLNQTFICSGVWCCYFILGLSIGANTVLVPQLRKEANSTEAISNETVSWLGAVYGFAGVPWVPVLPMFSHYFGRRLPFGLISLVSLSGAILFYCSTTVTHILISQILLSIIASAMVTIYLVILSEFSSPEYRGVFMTLKSASCNWGILVSNTLGTFFHWKTIGILQIVCCMYVSISVLIWPESPYWLARKRKYEECKKSFYWLNGSNEKAVKELNRIIEAEKEHLHNVDNDNFLPVRSNQNLCQLFTSQDIYRPLLLCMLLVMSYTSNGKAVCVIYALDVIKQITKSESLAYTGMLILDGISVFSMYIGCALSRIIKRKTMYVTTTTLGVIFLCFVTLYLYLIRFSIIVENKYVTLFLLSIYSITCCCGPLLLSSAICGELLPLKYKNTFVCILGMFERTFLGIVFKISPGMFRTLGIHGGFLVFAIISVILLSFLIKYLPETKDRTLHEIQDAFIKQNSKS